MVADGQGRRHKGGMTRPASLQDSQGNGQENFGIISAKLLKQPSRSSSSLK